MRRWNNSEPGDEAAAHTGGQWEASKKAYPPAWRGCFYWHPTPSSGRVPVDRK